jgi:predicted TIM-barrel fold metal-dependent hydrolase
MVQMSTTPVRDAPLQLGWPVLLDDVARRLPSLRLLVCHAGFPWTDECIALVGRHENMFMDVSYFNSVLDQSATYDFLMRARRFGCSWSKICWATDYPGFEFPRTLLPKFALVNDVAEDGQPCRTWTWRACLVAIGPGSQGSRPGARPRPLL